ncbi:hypothetical protein ACFLQY_03210 [Verrucomicrobiota bacterium]
MNCKQVNQFIFEGLGEEVSADVQAHIDQCESCGGLYAQQMMIKDLLSLRRYEEPKSGRVERGVANIMREVRLSEDRYERRQSHLCWMFSEPRYGVALLFMVFIGINLARTDHDHYATAMVPQDDPYGTEIVLLNEAPQVSTTNDYDYPEFNVDQMPGVMPDLGGPVKLVKFSEEK